MVGRASCTKTKETDGRGKFKEWGQLEQGEQGMLGLQGSGRSMYVAWVSIPLIVVCVLPNKVV